MRLAGSIEQAEQALKEWRAGRQIPYDARVQLELAYLDFLRFRSARSAWEDIHGADPGLLDTAKNLLDRLR